MVSSARDETETDESRVTMEYAAPSYHISDPAQPDYSLSIPMPSALSAFVIPSGSRRGSTNFFDLLEQLEVWKYLDLVGTGLDGDGGEIWRGRGRVPI